MSARSVDKHLAKVGSVSAEYRGPRCSHRRFWILGGEREPSEQGGAERQWHVDERRAWDHDAVLHEAEHHGVKRPSLALAVYNAIFITDWANYTAISRAYAEDFRETSPLVTASSAAS